MSPATWQRAVVLAVILCGGPAWAVAEDIPAVFLHGFNSDGTGWAATAERLRAQTAIEPRTPDLPWRQAFGDQTRDLWARPDYAGLPHDTVLVGHSNGGLVARESSRWRSLGGLVTIGSPHRGVPILPQFGHWATFGSWTSSLVASVVSEFARSTDWNWVFAYIVGSLNWAMDFSIWSVAYLGGLLGLDQALPVAAEVRPDSTYLQDLNSSWNLDREMQALDGRVGVVSIARNFYWAGPARVVAPDHADQIAVGLYGAAYGLLYWGNYVLTSADPLDFDATAQGLALLSLSGQLFSIDPFYCRLVSSTDLSTCRENDGLVPYTSQEYPSAPNLYIGLDNTGPAHTREREASADVLYDALVHFLGVPLRPSSPPSGPPDPPGGSEGDGGHGGAAFIGALDPDDALYAGDQVDSPSGLYHLIYQDDGNLVLYDEWWTAMWASETAGTTPGVAVMQGDGNLVIYDAGDVPRWSTGTYGHPGAFLAVQDDGNLVVYDVDGAALWSSGTYR